MIDINTLDNANATIDIPGSKSYTNRALPIAALADGRSILDKVLLSDDTRFMVKALNDLGIRIVQEGNKFIVEGGNKRLHKPNDELFLGNAGTATRFLTTLTSLLDHEIILTGNQRMQERPIQDLLDSLHELGVHAISKNNDGCPPVSIKGPLKGGKTTLKGNISSQFLSSLLISAPYAKNPVDIEIIGDLTSRSFIDITLDIMGRFGVAVEHANYKKFKVPVSKYHPTDYTIEGDASNASYFFAAAAITNGKVKVTNLNPDSVQGDIHFPEVLEKMGCTIKKGADWIEVSGSELKGIDIDMNQMPDTVQTLAVVAAFADGKTTIRNVENLRVKETDRIKAVAAELRKLGADVKELKDGLVIIPEKMHGAEIDTYDDHRMAMSFSLAGLKIPGVKIKDPDCVNKTFPTYFKEFERLYE